jgi:glucose-6-phosphate 1-dehydrogenase
MVSNAPTLNKPLYFVIFGATGNLYADKLARALFILFKNGGVLPTDFKIIAFARRDFSSGEFRTHTKDNILKKMKVGVDGLEDFLSHIEYFKGDFLDKNDFMKLGEILSVEKDTNTIFHMATAHTSYEVILKNLKFSLEKINGSRSILIEKPFGRDELDARHLDAILSEVFTQKQIFHIDHYLAKDTYSSFFDFRFQDQSMAEHWNNKNIKKIKVIFHESNIVGSRGASYDTVGAFRDVGQNHMLQLLSLSIMDEPVEKSGEGVRMARTEALENLYIDENSTIMRGQYEGYLSHPGVKENSATETFFRVFLKSKSPDFSGVELELESGKGLLDMNSDITTTTVAIQVYFKDGTVKDFKIQPVPGTVYDAYTKVYREALSNDQTLFVSMPEILAEWKITDEVLKKMQDFPLVVYKKGSKAEEIR